MKLKNSASNSTNKNLSILKQPVLSVVNDHLIAYPVPSNLNYFWGFGSLAGLSLVIQIATGVFLACHYTPDVNLAFSSVEHIMRDVQGGFLLRYMHANGASMFFIVTMAHMLRGLYYGSYQAPREAVWCLGVIILFLMIATAFMGGRICAPWFIEILCYNEMDVLCVEGGDLQRAITTLIVPRYMRLRAYTKSRLTMARITNLKLHNTGDRTPPATRTRLLLCPYTGCHPTSSGISSGSSKVCQRDGLRQYRRQVRQGPNVSAPTVSATEPKGTDDMRGKTCRSGERVVAGAIVKSNRHTAISCEGPQPGKFLGTAIKASQKIRNLDWSVFSLYELANALAQIEYYTKLARRNPGYLGRLDVHKILGNTSFLIYAYVLTKDRVAAGIDNVPKSGLTVKGIARLARSIREGTYKPKPNKRVMIPKVEKGKLHPLGIASSRDKVVQQALKLCLEPLFEPIFSNNSHGFRPGLSCHSALRQVSQWRNPTWLLEFDFAKAYDTINHRVLINRINSRFIDREMNKVIWKMLRTGYINPISLVDSRLEMEEGTPQRSIISPLMANIYFHALDKWMEDVVVPRFSARGNSSKVISEEYLNAVSRWKGSPWNEVLKNVKALTPGINTEKRREMIKRIRVRQARAENVPYTERNYTKLHYVRYADDFLLGYKGTKLQAKQIQQLILYFIENDLKMEVNVEKSSIKHKEEGVMFLGYKIWLDRDITVRNGPDESQRRTRTGLKFTIPIERLFRKYAEKGFFQKPSRGKTKRLVARYQTKYVFMHPYHIVQRYNSLIRGLVNYYSGSERLSDLHKFFHELRRSAALTIAHYHKESSAKKMFIKYGKTLKVRIGEGQQIVEYLMPSLAMREHQWRWNAGQVNEISLNKILSISVPKTMAMVQQAKDLTCAIPDCGSKAAEWHHVKHQRKIGGKGVKRAMVLHSARQIPVCKRHHHLIHKGAYDGPSLKKLPAYE